MNKITPQDVQPEAPHLQDNITLRACVERALARYFAQLEEQTPTDLYNLVLSEVEAPLLEIALRYTQGNQSRAAAMLGLSRSTLRKKLAAYQIDID